MPVEGGVVAGELASQGGGACLCLCLCSQAGGARRGEENHERQELGRVVEQLERLCVGENNNQRSLSPEHKGIIKHRWLFCRWIKSIISVSDWLFKKNKSVELADWR